MRIVSCRVLLMLVLLLTGASTALAQVYDRSGKAPFPHDKHAKLFPSCAGCHAGATTGDAASLMPPAASCVECHDGKTRPRVPYERPTPRHDFLRFVHRDHASRVEATARSCETCHATREGAGWMEVRRATPEGCQSCHTHRAAGHLAPDSRCASCHIAAAASRTLTAEDYAAMPKPPSHAMAEFLQKHGPANELDVAQCATCHSRDSCARCHVNAADVPAISQLLPDARAVAMLRGRAVVYTTPTDHNADAWATSHGRSATANTRRCAACHARPSCTVCHTGPAGGAVIRRLPDGLSGTPGVQLVLPRRSSNAGALARPHEVAATGAVAQRLVVPASNHASRPATPSDTGRRTVVTPHPDGFARRHAASAASARLSCEGCHAQRFCSDCHAGEARRSFHAPNFVVRHAPESYGRDLECSSCHNNEVFCRSCHQAQGLASQGQAAGSYHNAQPLWLLQHGQAARRGMQTCTTCHLQRDCTQCHSQRGWGVNPHGADFNASRLGSRAKPMCARCHITDPTRGR